MKQCLACGMPLINKADFSLGDENSDFCQYCTNQDGSPKSCQEIFDGGVEFFLQALGGDRLMAEKITRKNMRQLAYWQGKNCPVLEGEEATEAEFQEALAKLQ